MYPRHHSRRSPGSRLAAIPVLVLLPLAMIALAGFVPAAHPAELALEPILSSDQDLLQVSPCADGSVGVLEMGRVTFLQPGGEVARRVQAAPGERLYLSVGGAYVGVRRARHGAADFAPTETFALRDAAGTTLWRIGPTEDVSYAISARGTVVGLSLNINVPERNRLHFYGAQGKQIAEV
ncbi:MAG: hypothetical protein GF330_05160, partial [Candidatus Eisenbacteria bacterium]|nr:hypothetical protein [Candidatus Eisenbacteria bacterium]